ncbi:MAG: GNAT family N-acetyltransferase [Bacteroidetes bacterium]|nr:GNAT family N-acetyltransferase [Bacteroidota bacterium]
MQIHRYTALAQLDDSLEDIVDFLFSRLEHYGDSKPDIRKCLEYAFNKGGSLTIGRLNSQMAGIVVVNETGMSGFIPENILVYIAVEQSLRGMGIGRQLMQHVIDHTKGNIALHVEPDNPARRLYEKLGFTNKYLEMRLLKP